MDRIQTAETILQRFQAGHYSLLGAGFAGAVFHDGRWVYKVHVPLSGHAYGEVDHLLYLATKLDAFRDATHFYPLRELVCQEGVYILVYPFELSEPVTAATEDEWLSFLAEMWERKVICRSITLSSNFVRAAGVIKLIDYEIEPYDDNLFLNVIGRAFVQLDAVRQKTLNYAKLKRSLLNNFDLPELEGFWPFVQRVFQTIARRASVHNWTARMTLPDFDALFAATHSAAIDLFGSAASDRLSIRIPGAEFDVPALGLAALRHRWRLQTWCIAALKPQVLSAANEVEGRAVFVRQTEPTHPVALLVKACIQDTEFLDCAVRHIVAQLSGPDLFAERVLLLDLNRQGEFLRQFSSTGTGLTLQAAAERLLEAGVVDRVLVAPSDEAVIRAINRRWFNTESAHTHTVEGVPVASQLYAFEQMVCDRVLQVDVDALVAVRDPQHRYLCEMLAVLDEHTHVVSVGFQICHSDSVVFQPRFGFENGGFVPEVRCCLLSRVRLQQLCPLPNEERTGGLARSWYRAVEQRQRETGRCSVRGGATARYFIHPQNYRKAPPTTWPALIDRVEKLAIPNAQQGNPEVTGSLDDWSNPKRREDLVVVAVVEEENLQDLCRFLLDLEAQSCNEFGVLLIDNSGRRLAGWVARGLGVASERLTVIDRHRPVARLAAVHEAVRLFVPRDDTWLCFLDPGDVLIGRAAVGELLARVRLYGADILVGKELSETTLSRGGKHAVDFIEPRRAPQGLADGIRVVRRYLLDSLDIRDLQAPRDHGVGANTYQRLSKSHVWIDDPNLLSIVVPAVELSTNPIRFDFFNVLRRRSSKSHVALSKVAAFLQSRPRKREGAVTRGRKAFLPNLSRIEVDITYDCNLKCLNCNRSCTQAPTVDHMTIGQVRQFIEESIAIGKRWEFINVLGGEPTLHPQFQDIVRVLLQEYVDLVSPETVVQVTSNGYGRFVQQQLAALPQHPRLVVNRESFKESDELPYFTPFNDAPVDDPAFAGADYSKGCWVTAYCGIGLNHLGYFVCAVAGGIERVAHLGRGIQSLAEVDSSIQDMLATYCQFCGNYKHYAQNRGDFLPRSERDVCVEPVVSETWRRLYATERR